MFGLSNCGDMRFAYQNNFQKPCDRYQTGTVCFHNPSRKDLKIRVGDTKAIVESRTTICIDIYEGDYELKVSKGGHNWKQELYVNSCRTKKVLLEE